MFVEAIFFERTSDPACINMSTCIGADLRVCLRVLFVYASPSLVPVDMYVCVFVYACVSVIVHWYVCAR